MERRDSFKIPGIFVAIALGFNIIQYSYIGFGHSGGPGLCEYITVFPLLLLLFFFFGRGRAERYCFPISVGIILLSGLYQVVINLVYFDWSLYHFTSSVQLLFYGPGLALLNATTLLLYICALYDWFRGKGLLLCRVMASIRLAFQILFTVFILIETVRNPHPLWFNTIWLLAAQLPLPLALFLYYFLCFKAEPKASCDAKTGRNA